MKEHGTSAYTPTRNSRSPLSTWCASYMAGTLFTLLWLTALTGIHIPGKPAAPSIPIELELIEPLEETELQPEALSSTTQPSEPPRVNPVQKKSAPTGPAPQPQPPSTSTKSENLSEVIDQPQHDESITSGTAEYTEAIPKPAETASAALKIEPLFRLTRLPNFTSMATLKYPAAERRRGREGRVLAEFIIDTQGLVRDIKIVKSAGALFDQAVIDELGIMVFTPSYIGEEPVAARFQREFRFELD